MTLTLSSPCFSHGGEIPRRCTGDGPDESPPLAWSGAPDGTKSFALIVDDPDAPDPAAPRRTWVHWVVCDLPASATSLPEGVSGRAMPPGATEGKNDSGGIGYEGPYPPIGSHRYFFRLYALDTLVGLRPGHTKPELLRAIDGHVLASAELMGTYARERKA
jgi:Raf kinase inhibitor-like YbhB/YbcL family protein